MYKLSNGNIVFTMKHVTLNKKAIINNVVKTNVNGTRKVVKPKAKPVTSKPVEGIEHILTKNNNVKNEPEAKPVTSKPVEGIKHILTKNKNLTTKSKTKSVTNKHKAVQGIAHLFN